MLRFSAVGVFGLRGVHLHVALSGWGSSAAVWKEDVSNTMVFKRDS